jgi:hypothetical protein
VTEHPNEGVPRHPGGERGLEGGYPSGLGPPPHMPPQWPPQRPLPPREVGIAFKLWVAQIIFGLLSTVVLFAFSDPFAAGRQRVAANRAQGGGLSPQQFDTFLMTILIIGGVFGVLFLAVEVWLLLKMRRGRNWARITLTVLAGISVLGTLISLPQGATTMGITLVTGPIALLINIAAIVFMYRPAANAYFAAPNWI